MFCPECGREVPEGYSFCPGCGRYVSSGYTFEQVPQESVTTTCDTGYAESKSVFDGTKLITALIVVMVVVAIIVLPYYYKATQGELYGQSFYESFSGDAAGYTVISCEWYYLDGEFSCTYGVKNSDYSAHTSTSRNVENWSVAVDFVEVNDTVTSLESTLSKLYKQAFGTDPQADQKYADFILAFVQGSISYVTDQTQYHFSEYYAYPAETLKHQKGDCEDTAILCATLFKQAGFTAALLTLPGHMMAGVVLTDYSAPDIGDYGEILSQTIGGKTYYACETTLDSFEHVGVSYGSHNGYMYSHYLNSGVVGQGAYTFYEVPA